MKSLQKRISKELNSIAKRLDLKDISGSLYFPKYFEIETIRGCNAHCNMCTIYDWNNKNNRMKDELFNKIAEEIAEYKEGVNRICLSRNGEPLLDKNLEEKIRKFKNYGLGEISFSTNASMLNEKRAISIIESGLDDIRFSIDGSTKETFESIRGGLNYEQVINNCLKFIKLRNKKGTKPKVRILMVLQEENRNEEKKFKKFWLPKVSENDIVYSKPMHSWGNQLSSYKGDKKTEFKKYSNVPCISLWSTMIVHFDGRVPLCGCDYNNKILMGNLNKSSIKEIWTSDEFNEMRKMQLNGKRNNISLCRGCNIWDLDKKRVYYGGRKL